MFIQLIFSTNIALLELNDTEISSQVKNILFTPQARQ